MRFSPQWMNRRHKCREQKVAPHPPAFNSRSSKNCPRAFWCCMRRCIIHHMLAKPLTATEVLLFTAPSCEQYSFKFYIGDSTALLF